MFYVVSCPLGLLSTTVRPCTPHASHAEQTQDYISPSAAAADRCNAISRYHHGLCHDIATQQISTIRALDWSDVLKFPGTDDKPGSSVQDHL